MSRLLVVEAKFLLDAVFAFFGSKFGDFDGAHDHGIRIVSLSG